MTYRCNNCLYFPMEEKDSMVFICPNCGYKMIESENQHFARHIYENVKDKNKIDLLPNSVESFQSKIQNPKQLTKDEKEMFKCFYEVFEDHNKEVFNDTRRHTREKNKAIQ